MTPIVLLAVQRSLSVFIYHTLQGFGLLYRKELLGHGIEVCCCQKGMENDSQVKTSTLIRESRKRSDTTEKN